jgi:AcrR family transcriptional regulator
MTSGRRAANRGYGRLDRATIVAVGLGIARGEGLAAVTMRAIAEELGNAPMALYRHVADRQALIAGMVDAVMAGIVPPEPSDDPREEIIGLCAAVYRALRRDGWAVLVQVVDGVASPVTLPLLERLYAALRTAGLSDADCHRAVAALRHHTYGVLLGTHRDRVDGFASRLVRHADPVRYPALASATRAADPHQVEDTFELGLEILVSGLLAQLGPTRN